MKNKGLNDNKITVEAGIANGIIGKARKRGHLSQENISKILLRYPDLDANWLFRGTKPQDHSKYLLVNDSQAEYGCKMCKAKDEIIEALKDTNALLKEKVANIERSKRGPKSDYSETG